LDGRADVPTSRRPKPDNSPAAQQRRKAEERDRRIVELWRDRREQQRTGDEVWGFYGWLSEHQPALVPSGPGSYAHVRRLVEPFLIAPGDSKSADANRRDR
jgi:hypothetical protein